MMYYVLSFSALAPFTVTGVLTFGLERGGLFAAGGVSVEPTVYTMRRVDVTASRDVARTRSPGLLRVNT